MPHRLAFLLAFLLPHVYSQGLTREEVDFFARQPGINFTDHSEEYWLFEHSGIPEHEIGDFPTEYNPNEASVQNHDYFIPKVPNWLDEPGCLPMSTIAMSKSGVPFYNPYTGMGLDAVENEAFDHCEGHPSPNGNYHYHQLPSCLYNGGNNELMGVALDGYPIFGPKDENGVELTTADLDFCHGRWYNGRYQYHITADFPYVMACYRGEATRPQTMPEGGGQGGSGMRPPPPDGDMRPPPPDGGNGTRPPPPEGMGPGGMMMWESCYAYCANPGSQDSTCEEPEYDHSQHDPNSAEPPSSASRHTLQASAIILSILAAIKLL